MTIEPDAAIGAVTSLWRYPVKSMMGEQLETAYFTEHGMLGDRAYALIDRATGKVTPIITGTAFVNSEATHLLDERDPFCWGIL